MPYRGSNGHSPIRSGTEGQTGWVEDLEVVGVLGHLLGLLSEEKAAPAASISHVGRQNLVGRILPQSIVMLQVTHPGPDPINVISVIYSTLYFNKSYWL